MYKQEGQLIHQEHDEHGAIEIVDYRLNPTIGKLIEQVFA
jgi:hypothetical protein